MDYRHLTEDEILRLKSQSCLADDWGKVTVAEDFVTEFVHHTRFSGNVRLGVFQSEFTLPGGIKKHSGLRHVTLHNVSVGDNCCIENIQNYIANYEIGHDTYSILDLSRTYVLEIIATFVGRVVFIMEASIVMKRHRYILVMG